MVSKSKRQKESRRMIECLKSWKSLSYLMLPVLRELKKAYTNEANVYSSWKSADINGVSDLIEDLDAAAAEAEGSVSNFCAEIIKKHISDRAGFMVESHGTACSRRAGNILK